MAREDYTKDILELMAWAIVGTFIILFAFYYIEEHQPEILKTVEVQDVVVAKQSEQESINRFGQFRTNYYVLFESGELRKVELKEYMEFNVGDTLTWTETIYK